MFYRNPNPKAKYASHNGYDPYGFSTNGLVLYLPLWALKGTAFRSVDAYRHTCTVTGTTWGPTGRYYDGGLNAVMVPDRAVLDITTVISIEMWVRFDDVAATENLIHKRSGNIISNYSMWHIANELYIAFYTPPNVGHTHITVGLGMANNTWYHIVGIIDCVNDKVYIYVNGVSELDEAEAADMVADNNNVYIGYYSGSEHTGYIGEVRIYNRALSAGEILHNYNATKGYPYYV